MEKIKRLPRLQHIRRKFRIIKDNPQAQEIARLFGLLYHFEHKHRVDEDGWTDEDHILWSQRYSKVVLEKIHMRLTAAKERPCIPPDAPLNAAANHVLKQWREIPAIFSSASFRHDNNEVERVNRYVSLARRRLTIGSQCWCRDRSTVLF